MKVIEEAYGQVIDGTSAKQYLLGRVQEDDGTFGVVSIYGKIGAPTLQLNWAGAALSEEAATALYGKTKKAKAKYDFGTASKPAGLDVAALIASHGRV
jgi:hypothetical protein